MTDSIVLALVVVSTSALTVAGVMMLMTALRNDRAAQHTGIDGLDPAFLFDGTELVDANAPARSLLATLRAASGTVRLDWDMLMSHLDRIVPGARHTIEAMDRGAELSLKGDGIDIAAREVDGAVHIGLVDMTAENRTLTIDRLSYRAAQDELTLVRAIANHAPFPIWVEGEDQRVIWANAAYLADLAASAPDAPLTWPLPGLFAVTSPGQATRLSLPAQGAKGGRLWYDVSRLASAQGMIGFALPADAAQNAESTKRDVVRTLTKTFSSLPIGLAVFDRHRRMQMFNPALTDLTGLEPEFLLSRPGIEGFLNRMREKHVMPEPRDFRAWVQALLSVEGSTPNFEESWALPSGQTLRFCASPHPDGALAFTIEDITSETHMSAHQYAVLETCQSVLNLIDSAVAVFSPRGDLLMTNTAFSRLWTLEDESALDSVTLAEALGTWSDETRDPTLWQAIADLATGRPHREPVEGEMRLDNGERLQVRAELTGAGSLAIRFDPLPVHTPRMCGTGPLMVTHAP